VWLSDSGSGRLDGVVVGDLSSSPGNSASFVEDSASSVDCSRLATFRPRSPPSAPSPKISSKWLPMSLHRSHNMLSEPFQHALLVRMKIAQDEIKVKCG
jgi:hypothetical protein